MKIHWSLKCCLLTVGLLALFAVDARSQGEKPEARREELYKEMNDGNYKDAYDGLKTICLDPSSDPAKVPQDLRNAVACLQNLNRLNEFDALIEGTIEAHQKNWRLLHAAAQLYHGTNHNGFVISGEFERGGHRGGGQAVNAMERDRVRALQLMQQAMPLADKDDNKGEVAAFYSDLAQQMMAYRGYGEAWRLQYLTDIGELPDFDEGFYYGYYGDPRGAPVDEEGQPVFHAVAASWEKAESDGERWRWCLEQVVENDPSQLNSIRWQRASFAQNQFSVQTMQQFGYRMWHGLPASDDDTDDDESGTYALHTLKESETIAKLANGIKRFELPDDYNFIKIYQTIAAEPRTGNGENALSQLANVHQNRRQYIKAGEYWQQSIDEYGDPNGWKKKQIEQIEGNWGAFEGVATQPSGEGASVEFRFRNAKKVTFTSERIKEEKLLADLKAYLKSDPGQIDWQRMQKMNIQNLGYVLVNENQVQYVGEQVDKWTVDLKPRENHFDRRTTITTDLKDPGAYLVTAQVEGGNTSKIILWVADTAIVHKPLDGGNLYFVSDAVNGAPVSGAELEFFGYQQEHLGGRRFKINTKEFAAKADDNGQVIPDKSDLVQGWQWIVTARTKGDEARFAYLGYTNVWYGQHYDYEYNAAKVFVITDRPVYRPEDEVQFKLWVRHAQYDKEGESQFAGQSFPVEIYNPKGEKIKSETLTLDAYGGAEGKLALPEDATLGMYNVQLDVSRRNDIPWQSIQGSFRVEEYKKPEFEVTIDAPTEPVMLGEKITAKISAKYYFGSPVTSATVKYKILRTDYSQDWYPSMPWDWCFGGGYWWYCYDYPWYPGWRNWVGCRMPFPVWYWRPTPPPEVVAEQEVEIGADGTVAVEIDTQVAKELHGDTDHQYTITAEVRDESRRTIVGQGNVLVARKPFKVFTWVDRGYYRVGDVVTASFSAQTLDQQPVEGEGVLTLYKVTYDPRNQPIETPVRRWDLSTNVEGTATQQIRAAANGQYRLSYELTDGAEHTIEGGYLFTIIGEGFDGKDYRFNNIELIPDKADYQPGETVKLQINTDQEDSTVLLFIRPANSIYLPPKVVRIEGKSTVEEIGVVKKDMPNFFVEALTVSGGNVYQEAKEIIVPPEERVINVSIEPSAETYKPGEKARVKIQLTEFNGENYQGQAVVAVYDKSVEYISGGSNVPEIKEFYWKWRRHHQPSPLHQQSTNLAQSSYNLVPPGVDPMQHLGIFGATVAEEMDAIDDQGQLANATTSADDTAFSNKFAGGYAEAAAEKTTALADGCAPGGPPGAPAESRLAAGPAADAKDAAGGQAGGEPVQPSVRSNFADTALWVGAIETDATGAAEVELDMPENLTAWKINVWAMGKGTRVGEGHAEVVTRKDVIVRLQAPRFFVQKDEVVLSANVHNYLEGDKTVAVSLELPGQELALIDPGTAEVNVDIPAGGEKRVDWRVKVVQEGTAVVRMKALTDEDSDAMEQSFPVFVHGMLKTESWAGTVRPDAEGASVTINVPAERRPEQSVLEVRYSPTLAGAMVDALPYLNDYPYGCTEQTLNRFLPSVITQKTLIDMELDLAAIKEKRTNLNAQEIGDDRERAEQWRRGHFNPVFDEEELAKIVKAGIERLANMQVGDGGWGWFSGWGEHSYPHTTAVVVHGLQVAQAADASLPPGMLERGIEWLKRYQAEEVQKIKNADGQIAPWKPHADNLDAYIYMVLMDSGSDNAEMREFLYRDRTELAVYAKAAFGLGLEKQGDGEKLAMILKNIEQFLVQDAENETAYLNLGNDGYWWYWYGSEIEAHAYYLKLLSRTDPNGVVAPRLVKYLLNNRKHATYWNSTRDTAVCVEAFADYIQASGEDKPDMTVEIWLDGQKQKSVAINSENLFSFDNQFLLTGPDVADGEHVVEIRRSGKGPVYFNAYLTNFTLEDPITKAGLEVKVTRQFYKLVPVEKSVKVAGDRGQALDQKVEKYERVPLADGEVLTSGDLVEVELSIESKNDYEYIMFEDMKAAGFEPMDVRSGYTDNALGAYAEFRDEKVTFFVRQLARGNHSVAYRLRAEIPGKFSALPARAEAMYAPELKGNSDEMKLGIED